MKQALCALLIMGLSSAAFAGKPYYVCSLKNANQSVRADSEILVQFKDGKIAIKGETTGTCIGEVKYLGSDNQYGARFFYDGDINANCGLFFNVVEWYSTNEGFASIDTNVTVNIYNSQIGSTWADYTCK